MRGPLIILSIFFFVRFLPAALSFTPSESLVAAPVVSNNPCSHLKFEQRSSLFVQTSHKGRAPKLFPAELLWKAASLTCTIFYVFLLLLSILFLSLYRAGNPPIPVLFFFKAYGSLLYLGDHKSK